ncbi:MAG TPA: Rieske (2Fe-2S) protein [Candidatus Dormibacteraeota bacterium]|nr:Rieske (2Fe-2S) protein [Candidatus Dormibacteraeota bacterium]
MPDQERWAARRIDALVSRLLGGGRVGRRPGGAEEAPEIQAAARLAGSRAGYPAMSAAFREQLAERLQPGRKRPALTRRSALVAGFSAAAGAAIGVEAQRMMAAGSPADEEHQHVENTGKRGEIDPKGESAAWIDTGIKVDELVEDHPVRVTAGAVGVFVVKRGTSVVAMSAYCTHQPCELVWRRPMLNCPCHDQNFDLEGKSVSHSYPLPSLPMAKVKVVDGRVQVLGTVA